MVAISCFSLKGFGLLVFVGGLGPVGDIVVKAAWYGLELFKLPLRHGADSRITALVISNRFYTLYSLS